MTDKMREEFEAWCHESGYKINTDGGDFVICALWMCWKASRAALCVEFTKPRETDSSGLPCYDEYWREDVEDMLNSAGVRYK